MVVIIPNPNDELILVKLQKTLCSQYAKASEYICKSFPLWIEIPQSEQVTENTLKEFSKKITAVTINSPDAKLECSVIIKLNDIEYKSRLKPVKSKGLKKISPQEFPPVSLKKFRIGIIKQNSTNTVSITDSVWVKL